MGVFFGPDGFPVFLEGAVSVNGATLMTGFSKGLEGTQEFSVLSVPCCLIGPQGLVKGPRAVIRPDSC